MNIYFQYIKKTFTLLNALSKEKSIPRWYCFYDYFRSLLFHSCLIRQYVYGDFWKISGPQRKKVLTYRRICKLFDLLNQKSYIHFLENKSDFNSLFKDYVHRDWLYVTANSFEEFLKFAKKHHVLVVKPLRGVEGGGIRKIMVDGDRAHVEQIYRQLKGEDVLIEELIVQHPEMCFGNASVNTIRTHTILDSTGKAHVIKAILRVGVGSTFVDNYAKGGAIYEVDVKEGVVCSYGRNHAGETIVKHPQTDIVMLGRKIPLWDQVVAISEKAAEHLPEIRFIGWDVAIGKDKVQLIEGNHNPDYEFLEFFGSTGYYEKIRRYI